MLFLFQKEEYNLCHQIFMVTIITVSSQASLAMFLFLGMTVGQNAERNGPQCFLGLVNPR